MPDRRQSDIQLGRLIQSVETILQKIEEHKEFAVRIDDRLSILENDYTKYKSFFGGIVFIFSAFWAFMVFAWDHFRAALFRLLGLHP